MFRVLLLVVVCGAISGRALAADRPWVLQVGGGPLYANATDGPFLGRAFSVGAAGALRPWFLLGAEAAWLRVDGKSTYGVFSYHRPGDWDDLTFTALFRLQGPVNVGPSPFVEARSGVSWPQGSGEHLSYSGFGSTGMRWTSSVGLGLRVVVPRPWPDAEIGLRRHTWDAGYIRSMVEPRLSLAW